MKVKVLFVFGNRILNHEKEYKMGKKYLEAARKYMKDLTEQYFGVYGAHTPKNIEIEYHNSKNFLDHTLYTDMYYLKDIEDNTRDLAMNKYDYAVFLIDEDEYNNGNPDPMQITLVTIFNLMHIPYDKLDFRSVVHDVQQQNPNWLKVERGEIDD